MSAMNHKADAKKMCDLYQRICYVTKVPRLECTHCLTKRLESGAHAPCAGEVSEDEAQRIAEIAIAQARKVK